MRLIKYEISKVFASPVIRRSLIVLLILNALFCYYNISEYPKSFYDTIDYVFEEYEKSPDTVEKQYADFSVAVAVENEIWNSQIAGGNYDYIPTYPENRYGTDEYPDNVIYKEVFSKIENIVSYRATVEEVINQSKENLKKCDLLGISEDSYTYKYQRKTIEQYSYVKDNVNIKLENAKGWDVYYLYDIDNILIFILISILSITIFSIERQTDCLNILRVSKYGRIHISLSKGIVLFIAIITVNLLFSFENIIIIGSKTGFSSLNNSIQAFRDFVLCPYNISVLQYGIISFAFESIAYFSFSAIAVLITLLLNNTLLSYISTIGIYGINLALYFLRSLWGNIFINLISLVSVSTADDVLHQYSTTNFNSNPLSYTILIGFLYSVVLCLVIPINITLYSKTILSGIKIPPLRESHSNKPRSRSCIAKAQKRPHSVSIFLNEIYKILISSKYIYIVLALLIIKIGVASEEFKPYKSYSDQVYKEYMLLLEGELTPEKSRFITEEREKISSTLSLRSTMQSRYINNEISSDEYSDYLAEYNYALSRNEVLSSIEKHKVYIENSVADGKSAWFVYDSGWKMLFGADFDWTLFVVCLLIFSSMFAVEYSQKASLYAFLNIMRCCKKGRKYIFISKIAFCLLVSSVLAIVWCLIDLFFVNSSFDLPSLSAPIQSIESYSSIALSLSIKQYLACFIIVRVLSCVVLSLLSCVLSCLITKQLFTVMIASLLTLLPSVISLFNFKLFKFIDFVSFFQATPLLLSSSPIIYIILALILISFISIIAERKWCQ